MGHFNSYVKLPEGKESKELETIVFTRFPADFPFNQLWKRK